MTASLPLACRMSDRIEEQFRRGAGPRLCARGKLCDVWMADPHIAGTKEDYATGSVRVASQMRSFGLGGGS